MTTTFPQETGTFPQKIGTFADLSKTIHEWLRWLRLRRAVTWAVRGLTFGLVLALVIGLIGMFQSWLVRTEFLTLTAASALILTLIAAVAAYLWPIQPIKAARYFDRVFHLNERVSTALELNLRENPKGLLSIQTPLSGKETFRFSSQIIQQQLNDTIYAAQAVKPTQSLPIRLHTRDGLLALIFVALLGLTWFRGDDLFQAAQQTRAVQQAATTQAENIEQILTQIKNNDALSAEQKQALSAPLEQALNDLKDNPSLESSVSTLTSAGEKLQALSAPEAAQMAQSLKDAGSQAAAKDGSPLQSVGEKLAEGKTAAAASDLANIDASKLSQAQSQALAGQLETMAQTVAANNPQLAADLQDAAKALKNGDSAQAQQALDKAAQSMSQAGQQTAQSQAAAQAAQQMQQGATQMLAAGGGGQQSQAGQPGSGQPQANNQPGQMPGTSAAGSGQGQSQGSTETGQSGSSPIPQGNGPGNGGESTFEQIYAPSQLGGSDGQNVILPSSGQDGESVGQGPATNADPGQSLVPYQQVYSQYDQSNHQAIENGAIPFEFLETVRNYFDSLKP